MANHRMFSNRIANSAKFLQMPAESQVLYFHMVLRADDDGVVESYPIVKLLGVAPDNFKVLIAKEFIRQLNEDQVVVIPDWLEHNTIRADRKVNSIYHHLLPKDIKTISPKPRSDVEDNSKRVGGLSMVGISQVKLSKVKLNKQEKNTETSSVEVSELIKSFEVINPASKKFYGNKTQRSACEFIIKEYGFERAKIIVEKTLPKTNGLQYFPTITTPLQLQEKWSTLESAVRKLKNKSDTEKTKQGVCL